MTNIHYYDLLANGGSANCHIYIARYCIFMYDSNRVFRKKGHLK